MVTPDLIEAEEELPSAVVGDSSESERARDYFADRVWMDEIVPSNSHFTALREQRRSARR